MDWFTKRIVETDLFVNSQGFLRQFGIDPIQAAPALLSIAQDYSFNVAEVEEAGSRSDVLVELHELAELSGERQGRRLPALSDTAIRSLCGLFPSSTIAFEAFGGDGPSFRVIDDPKVIVSTFKSSVAHRSAENIPLVMSAHGDATVLARTAVEDIEMARKALSEWAKQEPASFADHVNTTVSKQEETFQVAGQVGGRNIGLYETVFANPDWRLINSVLDLVWPVENGMLHSRKRSALVEILTQTKAYALANPENADREDSGHIDANLVSAVLTLRHQINSLNQSLRFLETRREVLQRADNFSEAGWRREERLDRVAFYPLLDWRRELERRLLHGDYRSWKSNIRRATGPVVKVPDMPIFNRRMSLLHRTLMLIHAAGRSRRETSELPQETSRQEASAPGF